MRDNQFRKADQLVAARGAGTKTLNHPITGELTLDWDTLTVSTDPDQQLLIWTAEPGTPHTTDSACWPSGLPPKKPSTNPPHAQRRTPELAPHRPTSR